MENIKKDIISKIIELSKKNENEIIKENIIIKKTQVNYKNFSEQPKSIIDLIKIFKKIHESLIKTFNTNQNFELKNNILIQINEIKEYLGNYKVFNERINITINYPNKSTNLDKEKQDKLEKLYKKFIKEYGKSNNLLLGKINYLFETFKLVFIYLKNLGNSCESNIKEFEETGNFLKNIKDDDPKIYEGSVKIYNSYVKSVESFKKYEEFFNQIKKEEENWKKEKLFDKLEKLIKDINDQIESNKNIFQDIENYFPKIVSINIDELNNIYNKLIHNLEKIQKYRIEENQIYNNNKMRLDILIILDITYSMEKYLKLIKEKIKFIIKKIKENCPLSIIYLGFIGYKDFEDLILGDNYTDIDFTIDIDEIYNQIKDLEADGGVDIPEDIAGAFELALKKSWGSGKKLAFLITDSPCHGVEYHDLNQKNKETEDHYPKGKYEPKTKNEPENTEEFIRRDIKELVKEFAKKGISLVCLDILKNTKKMFNKFKEIYESEKESGFSIEKVKKDNKNTLDNIIIKKATEECINVEEIKNDLRNKFII